MYTRPEVDRDVQWIRRTRSYPDSLAVEPPTTEPRERWDDLFRAASWNQTIFCELQGFDDYSFGPRERLLNSSSISRQAHFNYAADLRTHSYHDCFCCWGARPFTRAWQRAHTTPALPACQINNLPIALTYMRMYYIYVWLSQRSRLERYSPHKSSGH